MKPMTKGKKTLIYMHQLEQLKQKHPEAVPLGKFWVSEAIKWGISERTIAGNWYRGWYPNKKTERINARVVLVLNP